MAAAADYVQVAQQLYVSYFGRPADLFGLNDMTAALAGSGAPTDIAGFKAAYSTNNTVKSIIDNFGNSPESTALYSGDNTSFITAIFQNVLNRDPLIAGLTYWVKALENKEMSRAEAATQILAAATKEGGSATDAATVANKVTVATNFTTAIDTAAEVNAYKGAAAAAAARAMLHTVDNTTVAADFQATVESTLATLVTGAIPVTNTSLTLNQDTLTGGAGNDTFNAGAAAVADGSLIDTLQNADAINGGAGNDTLNVTLTQGATIAPTLTNVENVILRVTDNSSILNLGASTGVTSVTVANSNVDSTVTVQAVGAAALAVKNQTFDVGFAGSTAATLALGLDTVGVDDSDKITVDVTAAVATALNITANNAFADVTGTAAVTAVNVAATGASALDLTGAAAALSLTVTGAGSVDFSGVNLTALKTLTAGDGGVTVVGTAATAVNLTAVTGAGKDSLTFNGANVKSITTGAGNDTVNLNTANLAATATVDLGAGDDTLNFSTATFSFAGGATLKGGDGTDTLGVNGADYLTIAALTSAQRAKVTGFEVIKFADHLDTQSYDLSKFAGVTSVNLAAGVEATKTATVTGLGAAATVTIAGDLTTETGTLIVALKTDTDTDVTNVVLKSDFADDNGTTSTATAVTVALDATGIETVNINSTGHNLISGTPVVDYAADTVTNTLTLTNDDLVNLNISGDQAFVWASAAGQTALVSVDAHTNTAGVNIDLTASVADDVITLTGSATAANVLVGSASNDVIVGGAKADTITGGLGGDTLTGGAGNDTFKFLVSGDSTITADQTDTINDFSANTKGDATVATKANADATTWTGDVIDISFATNTKIKVGVYTNASDATTFIATGAAADATFVYAALDSTAHKLYIDTDANGVADMYISLPGVNTITAAAFVV
jgi:S-layer protein